MFTNNLLKLKRKERMELGLVEISRLLDIRVIGVVKLLCILRSVQKYSFYLFLISSTVFYLL